MSGFLVLAEYDLFIRAELGSPGPYTPLKGAANPLFELRIVAHKLIEHRRRPYSGGIVENREHLGVPDAFKRVPSSSSSGLFLLGRGRTPGFLFDSETRYSAETRLGRSSFY